VSKNNILYCLVLMLLIAVTEKSIGKIREQRHLYTAMHIDQENIIWFGTPTGLFQWQQTATKKINIGRTLPIRFIASTQESLILVTSQGKIFTFHKNKKQLDSVYDFHVDPIDLQPNLDSGFTLILKNKTSFICKFIKGKFSFSKPALQDNIVKTVSLKNKIIIFNKTTQTISSANKASLKDTNQFSMGKKSIAYVNDLCGFRNHLGLATSKGVVLLDTNWEVVYREMEQFEFEQIEKDQFGFMWLRNKNSIFSNLGETFMLSNKSQEISVDTNTFIHHQAQFNYLAKRLAFNADINALASQNIKVAHDKYHQDWISKKQNGIHILGLNNISQISHRTGLSSQQIIDIKPVGDYMAALSDYNLDIINPINFQVVRLSIPELGKEEKVTKLIAVSNQPNQLIIESNVKQIIFQLPMKVLKTNAPVVIDEVFVVDEIIDTQQTKFNYEKNYFKFNFHSRDNINEVIFFRYKLQGLNDVWVNTSEQNVTFPRLNDGEYNFIVQASTDKNFNLSSETSYKFTIQKPFWKQAWFLLGCSLMMVSIIYYLIQLRDTNLHREKEYAKEKAIAEFETLKQQVNPHFLFNSFNTLIQLIDEDKNKAINYTQQLSDFYRSLLSYKEVQLISLEEDLKLMNNFIAIHKTRVGNNLNLIVNIPSTKRDELMLPPLTLQLLAENAIKHNVISNTKPLLINIYITENSIHFINNLNNKDQQATGKKIGLENIKNRCKYFSKTEIIIRKDEDNFEVILPFISNAQLSY